MKAPLVALLLTLPPVMLQAQSSLDPKPKPTPFKAAVSTLDAPQSGLANPYSSTNSNALNAPAYGGKMLVATTSQMRPEGVLAYVEGRHVLLAGLPCGFVVPDGTRLKVRLTAGKPGIYQFQNPYGVNVTVACYQLSGPPKIETKDLK